MLTSSPASALARKVAEDDRDRINTDDDNIVEFGFARTMGSGLSNLSIDDVRRVASAREEDRPASLGGTAEWDRAFEARVAFYVGQERRAPNQVAARPIEAHRVAAMLAFGAGNSRLVKTEWAAQPEEPHGPTETALLGMALADLADESALRYAESQRSFEPAEADAIVAHLRLRQGRLDEATTALESVFTRLRVDPWPLHRILRLAIEDAPFIASRDARLAPRLYGALAEPFVLHLGEARRQKTASHHRDAGTRVLVSWPPPPLSNRASLGTTSSC